MHAEHPNPPLHPLTRSTPYDAPRTPVTPRPKLSAIPHRWVFMMAAVPLVGAFVGFALRSASLVPSDLAAWVFLPAAVVGLGGVLLAIVNLVRSVARIGAVSGGEVLSGALVSVLSGFAAFFASGVATAMLVGSGRGRQLRHRGRPLHAELHEDTPWIASGGASDRAHAGVTRADDDAALGDVALHDVAEAWRTNGKTEHASVAAFAELSIDLVALGAPPRLIEAAHRDALDEMRHTELCFGLAHSLDGRPRGPRDFMAAARLSPRRGPRTLQLARLAVTSLYDGALYEGLSARVVAELARGLVDPRVQTVLRAIARDEARHAAHGFDVVRWCVEAGGAPVLRALEVAVAKMRTAAPHSLVEDARAVDGRWERWGIPSRDREVAAWALVRDRVVARTERLLAAHAGRAAHVGTGASTHAITVA